MRDKAIITSALPYSNGEIHLGHVASTYLPADVTTRFLRQKGVEAYYICASDDYGTPILIQSEKEGKSPEEYVAYWNKRYCEDFSAFNIAFDLFYKTSSKENIAFVQSVFKKLQDAGHIYESEIIQFYCKNDKKFLPDRYVIGTCPYCKAEDQYSDLCEKCGRVPEEIENPHCSICGQTPVKEKTKHYFFKLKNFSEQLNKYLDNAPYLQKDVKKYVQNWIKSGLIDWDITRDISWGVPIPGSQGQVFYGWVDNHLAYISSALKFLNDKGIDGKEFWNLADVYHFIGLKEFLKYYPTDYLRFYLIVINPYSQDDINFDWDEFATKINSELIGNLGNFVNRALGFTKKSFGGKIPTVEETDQLDKDAQEKIQNFSQEVSILMEQNHLDRALKKILEFSAHFNQYFQHKEPWKNGKGTNTCVYLSANAVRSIAIALYPFIPESAQKIWIQLGMEGNVSEQSWDSMSKLSIKDGHTLGIPSPLFVKVEESDIEKHKKKLGNKN